MNDNTSEHQNADNIDTTAKYEALCLLSSHFNRKGKSFFHNFKQGFSYSINLFLIVEIFVINSPQFTSAMSLFCISQYNWFISVNPLILIDQIIA